ncbi:hypothetical protein [Nonlabens marinus]|uniref:Uncharacterized protein n=1 Tax=Nonlabens marinus S1-08 TaxID=1454201 RepID=W8VWR4_9FLAO|nr:hypothetical protein [Nonlabens marinus]BAO54972.1 hypothetical protein NMS_0963 [Nonlabens marinus S1-08]
MFKFSTKWQKIYLPFIALLIGSFFSYNILRWLLDFELGWVTLPKWAWNFWIPFFFPWIPIFIWYRKKLNLLDYRHDKLRRTIPFLCAFLISLPLIISQFNLHKAAFEIITVQVPATIKNYPEERYFRINRFGLEKKLTCEDTLLSINIRGMRGGNNAKIYLNFAGRFEGQETIYFGVHYQDQLNNIKKYEKQNEEVAVFLNESRLAFTKQDFQEFAYFEKVVAPVDKKPYIDALSACNIDAGEDSLILIPRKRSHHFDLGRSIFDYGIAFIVLFSIFFLFTFRRKISNSMN